MLSFIFQCAAFAVRYLISTYGVALPMVPICSDSPRVYLSTNPWKVTSTFQTVSSTREEYVALIEKLKASASPKPKLKVEFAHQNLTAALEARLEIIDKELLVRISPGLFITSVTCDTSLPMFIWLTFIFSGCSGHAKRLSSATFSLLKLKSGKLERGGRPLGLITSTTTWKPVTYVLFLT